MVPDSFCPVGETGKICQNRVVSEVPSRQDLNPGYYCYMVCGHSRPGGFDQHSGQAAAAFLMRQDRKGERKKNK